MPTTTATRPRIAWLGPTPQDGGGVPAMAGQVVRGLAERGAQVEMFLEGPPSPVVDQLARDHGIVVHHHVNGWQFDRWYSSTDFTKLVTGTTARLEVQRRLAQTLADRHAVDPFDVVYRLSQIEFLALRRVLDALPPIVIHPEVHAQGERDRHWRERALARRAGEHAGSFAAVQAYLAYRTLVQRRDAARAAACIAPSRRFAAYLERDYGVDAQSVHVVTNVVDLDAFHPAETSPAPQPVRLLFVARMAVRKGVEQVVGLSHRLRDLVGELQIDCIGGASLFSDYRGLLDDLDPGVATYLGRLTPDELADRYRASHGLIQPSWYEPFALTVAEALASGLPVIVSDEVGAAEGLDADICRVHAAGDLDALERHVRALVAELRAGRAAALAARARAAAEQRFHRRQLADDVLAVIREIGP